MLTRELAEKLRPLGSRVVLAREPGNPVPRKGIRVNIMISRKTPSDAMIEVRNVGIPRTALEISQVLESYDPRGEILLCHTHGLGKNFTFAYFGIGDIEVDDAAHSVVLVPSSS